MAKDQTRALKRDTLEEDRAALNAAKAITNYAPANPAYALPALDSLKTALEAAYLTRDQAEAAVKKARDGAVAAEWAFHNGVLGLKEQVIAQFGKSSDEVQSLGLKKKSEYKSPTTSKTPPAGG